MSSVSWMQMQRGFSLWVHENFLAHYYNEYTHHWFRLPESYTDEITIWLQTHGVDTIAFNNYGDAYYIEEKIDGHKPNNFVLTEYTKHGDEWREASIRITKSGTLVYPFAWLPYSRKQSVDRIARLADTFVFDFETLRQNYRDGAYDTCIHHLFEGSAQNKNILVPRQLMVETNRPRRFLITIDGQVKEIDADKSSEWVEQYYYEKLVGDESVRH